MTNTKDLLPHDIQAERATLGSILIDPDALLVVAPIVESGNQFYDQRHGMVYEAMRALGRRSVDIDFITVCDQLEADGTLDTVTPAYLTQLINEVPTSIHARHYAGIVADKAARRRLIAASASIAKMAYQEDVPVREAESQAVLEVLDSQSESPRGAFLNSHMSAYYDHLERVANGERGMVGLSTGFQAVDDILRGMDGFCILAGRPSMGKSALMLDIALNLARQGKRIAYFSLEDSRDNVITRVIAKRTGLSVSSLRSGKRIGDTTVITTIAQIADVDAAGKNIWLDDSPGLKPSEVFTRSARLQAEFGLDVVMIDYLQLMRSDDPYKDRQAYSRVSDVSQAIQAMSRNLNVPILAAAQLSREVERRVNKRPILSDLRETGQLEQDAASVLMLYRDEQYYPDDTDMPGLAEVIVAKNKNGPTGTAILGFKRESVKFSDVTVERIQL